MTATIPEALHRGRDLAVPALREAVDRLAPRMRLVTGYHLGWCEADGAPAPRSGGKALRPALAVLSACAAGAPAETGVPAAVAVECVHNFSLLHDDVMDGDVERRHRPTVWTVFGVADAVLAGDALLALAQQVLLEVPGETGRRAAAHLADATQRLIAGQSADLEFESRTQVGVDEVLVMEAGKTGALLGCAASLGAVLAGAPPGVVDVLTAYGEHLGLAFQLVDDLLGIWGDPAATGKPVLADLRARKKSVPIVAALTADLPESDLLADLLATAGRHDEDTLRRMAGLVDAAGGREWARAAAARELQVAQTCLDGVALDPGQRAEFADITRFMTEREA
jgi:geranylgeranyl diphosphate synthase type I